MPATTVINAPYFLACPGGGEAENGFDVASITGSNGLFLPNGKYAARLTFSSLGSNLYANSRRATLFLCCTTSSAYFADPATFDATPPQQVYVAGVGTVKFYDNLSIFTAGSLDTPSAQLLGPLVGSDSCQDFLGELSTDFEVFDPSGQKKVFVYVVVAYAAHSSNTYIVGDVALSTLEF